MVYEVELHTKRRSETAPTTKFIHSELKLDKAKG